MTHDRDREIEREIRAHLEVEAEERAAEGLPPDEAVFAARRAFGSVTRAREDVRALWAWRWFEDLRVDARLAVRGFVRSPAFTCVALLTLALGIGANTAIFSLTDQVLIRTLPVYRPHELVMLDGPGTYQGRTVGDRVFSVPMFRGLQDASSPVIDGLFARYNTGIQVSIAAESENVSAELVSGEYFSTLGVRATVGRTLGPEDDRTPSGHPFVVLSHAYWQRRFAGASSVLNRDIRINGHPMTIVGVADAGFSGVEFGAPADLFVPLMMKRELTPTWDDLENWRTRFVNVMGRLRSNVSREQTAAALGVTYRRLLREDLATVRVSVSAGFREQFLAKDLLVRPGGRGWSPVRDDFSTPLMALTGMVALVLLIACANVANLLLARAMAEQKDAAVRLALGAGRLRLVRQRLAESLVLGGLGGTIGLLAAWWTTGALIAMLPFDGARALTSRPDARVALFGIGVTAATALAVALVPALQASRLALTQALKDAAGVGAGGFGRARLRKALVVAQVAASILLLSGAVLFARSLYNLRTVDPGFSTGNLLQFRVLAALSGYTRERALVLFRSLQDGLDGVPGVASVSMATVAAMNGSLGYQTIRVQGYQHSEGENMSPGINVIGPDYFATMGMPLIRGREFRESDRDGAPRVAIVNETMAKYFWGDGDPIGRRFGRQGSQTDDEFEVVGVVRDAKFTNLRTEISRFFYLPYMQADTLNAITFYIRYRPNVEGVSAEARRVVAALAPDLPVLDMRTMEAQVDESLSFERLVAALAVVFGGVATLLATVGLYGVTSYTVSRRTREIGIRVALGAPRSLVLWMVLRDVVVLLGAGMLIGLPVALALGGLVESQLFGLSSNDPLALGAAAATLAAITLIAGYAPARRAASVNPMLAIRQE